MKRIECTCMQRYAICNVCQAAKMQQWVEAEAEVKRLLAQLDEAMECLRLVYRKHRLNDESIGWQELGEKLLNTILNNSRYTHRVGRG